MKLIVARWILHVDLDQFLAAVEVRRRPELAWPAGGRRRQRRPDAPRTVVATASYEARAFGIHVRHAAAHGRARGARTRCSSSRTTPTYEAASEVVMDALRTFPVRVEVLGWDEAFIAADDR